MAHLAEGLYFTVLLTLKIEKYLYLPCRHTNTISALSEMAVFVQEVNEASRCRRVEWSVLKCKEYN
jgi:hypothetical protein